MAGKLSEVSTGVIAVIAVNAANRMPTDNKEKEPRVLTTRFLRSLEDTAPKGIIKSTEPF